LTIEGFQARRRKKPPGFFIVLSSISSQEFLGKVLVAKILNVV
jgi:hypothetical protein